MLTSEQNLLIEMIDKIPNPQFQQENIKKKNGISKIRTRNYRRKYKSIQPENYIRLVL